IEEEPPHILYIDESVRHQQMDKLKKLKARRSNDEVTRRLEALKKAAAQEPKVKADGTCSDANTMPYIIEAVRAYATVGEICDALREVYGTYEETSIT
ncbi:MAG TPA: methylmalonyl-CoA mutase family protein, partial [Terriglobales bacterium]|nr:methylmalonyl-CoA mutase family protein [Terriglobales bacterium]